MSRLPRRDAPDTWHHVMNRALARRTLFEYRQDFRMFLASVAKEARRGRLETHAFALMPTHFHLLARSPMGLLSESMRVIQNRYSRWFNRSRRRDGPLYRGRFLACEVDTLRYRRNVVQYIHDNPIEASLAAVATEYEWCSARLLTQRPPPWLSSDWIDDELERRGTGRTRAQRLASAFPTRTDPDFRAWVERNLRAGKPRDDWEGAMKHVGSPKVARWMHRKAALADGTRPFQPVSLSATVDRVVLAERSSCGPLLGVFARTSRDGWPILRAGLLRSLAGATLREISARVGRSGATCWRDLRDHARFLNTNPGYARLAARLTAEVVRVSD